MVTHFCIIAGESPWTEEPGGLYSPWGCKESDMTEQLHVYIHIYIYIYTHTHIHVSFCFPIFSPFRLLQSINQISLCYTICPCWLSILNTALCTCQSQMSNLSLPPGNHKYTL